MGPLCQPRPERLSTRSRSPGYPLEAIEHGRSDEAAAGRVDMPVGQAALLMGEESLGVEKVKFVLRPRHGDVEEAALLLDLGAASGARSLGMQPSTTFRM